MRSARAYAKRVRHSESAVLLSVQTLPSQDELARNWQLVSASAAAWPDLQLMTLPFRLSLTKPANVTPSRDSAAVFSVISKQAGVLSDVRLFDR